MIQSGYIGNIMQLTGTPIHGQEYDPKRMITLDARYGIEEGTLVDFDAFVLNVSKDPHVRLKQAAETLAHEQKSGIIRLSRQRRCHQLKQAILERNPEAVVYICTPQAGMF